MSFFNSPTAGVIGILLMRVIVPLWVLAGAIFKLAERVPGNLPQQMVNYFKQQHIDLGLALRTLIGLEFLAVIVMVLMPRLISRLMAIFMTASFCAILINEIAAGSKDCGCFGSASMNPWVMLAIDGALLIALLLFRPGAGAPSQPRPARLMPRPAILAAAIGLIGTSFGVTFALPEKELETAPTNGETLNTTDTHVPLDSGSSLDPAPAQSAWTPRKLGAWHSPRPDEWIDKSWREISLLQFMKDEPQGLDEGRMYLVFYRKSCEHCHELFQTHFMGKLAISTIAIAIPPDNNGPEGSVHPMPCTDCTQWSLPGGPQWMITAPLIVALEDGKVVCAAEGIEDMFEPECVLWEPMQR